MSYDLNMKNTNISKGHGFNVRNVTNKTYFVEFPASLAITGIEPHFNSKGVRINS